MKFKLISCFVILVTTLLSVGEAQNLFTTKISFPSAIQLSKINIEYHNGFKIIPFKIDTVKHVIEVSGTYYSKFPELIINYADNNSKKFFLEKKSSLTFYTNSKNNIDSVKLSNAYDFKDVGEQKFNLYAKAELEKLETYLKINSRYINDSESVYRKFIELDSVVQRKKLQFIQNNSKLFYSLWLFREEFVSNTNYNVINLLSIYNQSFASKFSKTFEAKQIVSVLEGRLNTYKGKKAPLFSSKDIKGNNINLSDFKDKKYVLLNFWATWCGPCVAEIPMLDSIYKYYSQKDIVIISVSEDRNEEKCLKAIKKLQMNWINIINDPTIEGAYGNNPALPQVYLIDKAGKIIYSRTEMKDSDLKLLLDIVKQL